MIAPRVDRARSTRKDCARSVSVSLPMPGFPISRPFAALLSFSIQLVVGGVAFIAVFLVAVAIAGVVHFFEARGLAPPWLATSARYAEIAIWVVDLVVFGLFILAEVIKSVRAFTEDLFSK
ncbi:MAG: hypothetical protein ACT6TH_06115 [Brevundimonas sp.]|uniref:hypothetical protein n=1 Tax=Brevundimonas sp. TaxID=1871086 RepID=UPI0040349546